jgi:hypothetical protein
VTVAGTLAGATPPTTTTSQDDNGNGNGNAYGHDPSHHDDQGHGHHG